MCQVIGGLPVGLEGGVMNDVLPPANELGRADVIRAVPLPDGASVGCDLLRDAVKQAGLPRTTQTREVDAIPALHPDRQEVSIGELPKLVVVGGRVTNPDAPDA